MKTRFKWLSVFLLAALIASPVSIARAESPPETIDAAKLDAFMESALDRLHIPGAALGIVKGDRAVYVKGYGTSGPEGTPVTPQTPFVLGSTSKSFTALAVMQLAEEGKIDLEAPVRDYLPDFRLADEAASEALLVKHLLEQTSGLSTYDGRLGIVEGDKSVDEHIRDLASVSPSMPVGSGFQYSNLNYNILGGIVQAVSGMPFDRYINERIFQPLEMNSSYASIDDATADRPAAGHQPVFGFMTSTPQLAHEGTVASGYLLSSAEDMTHYLIAQMNEGRYRNASVLSAEGVEQMHRPSASMGGGASYAMGWVVNENVVFHDGMTENTYSFMAMTEDYGFILLINANDFLVPYDGIAAGINGILNGQERSASALPNYVLTYAIADFAALLVLAYIVRSAYLVWKWRTGFKATKPRIALRFVSIALFHLLVPLAILMVVPKLNQASWEVAFLFLPGLAHVFFYASILLLITGLAKAIAIVRAGILRKRAA